MFINVGCAVGLMRPRTKKALREALRDTPEKVMFDRTSPLDTSGMPQDIKVADLRPGMKLSVCGPDPYTDRRWWATIELKNGQVKVS